MTPWTHALDAYEAFAPYYDEFTASYDHDRWLENLERLALENGLSGRRALDVGCGTGKSFAPLLRRGYAITACDISPAMVRRARVRAEGHAEVVVADMRDLPALGSFDLALCLDDAVNYLLSYGELGAAFRSIAANLRVGGVLVFDVNSLSTFRTAFASSDVVEEATRSFTWEGLGDPAAAPGCLSSAVIETAGDAPMRVTHVQRHHPESEVRRALEAAGLEVSDLRGQVTGALLERPADEARHVKLVYVARKLAPGARRG
jgi:SAM-dependent methyltransferase